MPSFIVYNKILMPVHQNPDKAAHDKPPGDRSALFPLHPFRLICASPPGGGKRQLCLDTIGRHPRAFDTITIIHLAPKSTEEYKILGDNVTMLGENELPEPDSWDRDKRNLLIIDEINVSDKRPAWKKQFDRLFNYASTHHSLSIKKISPERLRFPCRCAQGLQSLGDLAQPRYSRTQHNRTAARNQTFARGLRRGRLRTS